MRFNWPVRFAELVPQLACKSHFMLFTNILQYFKNLDTPQNLAHASGLPMDDNNLYI